jgi:hypothetical protein
MTSLPTSITDVAVEDRDHSIHDFLSRPRVLAQGTIPAGGAINDLILSLSFPNDLLTLTSIREKLKGFLYLRSDIIVNIIFTVAPTTSGSFRAIIAPDLDPSFLNTRTRNAIVTSQFPNHIINVADMPNLVHTIPWISQYTHRNLTDQLGNAGYYRLYRLTPTSAPVSYIVYASFDTQNSNFSLTQATPAAPRFAPLSVSQSDFDLIKNLKYLSPDEKVKLAKTYPSLKYDAHVKTESAATNFGLSKIASATGALASTLKGIPLLGSVAQTVVPIANLAANIFSAFGFSRPNNEQPVKPYKLHPAHDNVTSDGTHTSHTFAMQNLNTVKTSPGTYGSETDDLALARIYRHPNFTGSFTISTSQTYRQVIGYIPMDGFEGVGFSMPTDDDLVSIANNITLTHQSYCMMLFKYWLAKIVINVHVFATQFHSVKLRFIIAPGYHDSVLPPFVDDSNSVVVNFGKNSFHQIKFPEVTNRQFLLNRHADHFVPPFDTRTIASNVSLGSLFICIEVPLLTMNDTVSPTIHGITEHFFEDARFMVPLNFPIVPQLAHSPTKSVLPIVNAHIESLYVTTANTSSSNNSVVSSNMDAPKHNFTAYEQTSGEAIVSLRQFATQFTEPLLAISPETLPGAAPYINYDPFRTFYLDPDFPNDTHSDKLDYILAPFAFHKGSRHVRIYFASGDSSATYLSACLDTIARVTNRITVAASRILHPFAQTQRVVPIVKSLEGVADFHLPYYQPYHMVRNQPANSPLLSDNHADPLTLIIRPTVNFPYYFSRAVGDDFSAGYLCGLPPFTITGSIAARIPPRLP